ncbi:hypothetical protein [Kribbella sp. NPDC000426]|uniref:hypothetical protein n=1 Tax=Kribbella sp. NPDC000426 TaxID=3154255 RepID=UPI00332D7E5E
MSDLEKDRAQRDAQRTASGRRSSGSANPEQAMLRHLGIELYKECRRSETPKKSSAAEDQQPTDGSTDR